MLNEMPNVNAQCDSSWLKYFFLYIFIFRNVILLFVYIVTNPDSSLYLFSFYWGEIAKDAKTVVGLNSLEMMTDNQYIPNGHPVPYSDGESEWVSEWVSDNDDGGIWESLVSPGETGAGRCGSKKRLVSYVHRK